jgi:acyl-CoA thioesterase-1
MWYSRRQIGRNEGAPSGSYGNRPRAVQALARLFAVAIACAGLAAAAADRPVQVVAFGDSLTAGLGLPADAAFPAKLQQALAAKGIRAEIANAGVSGDTSVNGLARLDWSIPEGTEAVILELGANDALRGLDPAVTRTALDAILQRLEQRRIAVLLCGMLAPRNLGADYARQFDAMFSELAAAHGALFYPFFLDGVAGEAALNLRDGLHPSAAGVEAIVERILPQAEALIARAKAMRGS